MCSLDCPRVECGHLGPVLCDYMMDFVQISMGVYMIVRNIE